MTEHHYEQKETSGVKKRRKSILPAFEIDDRIILKVEFELAGQLGKLILDSDIDNTALLAIGHQLRNMTNE